MKKKREWRKALSVMLAVSMMLQSCTVVSAGETEPEIIVEHEGQSSGDEKKETKKSDFPEISIESVVPETKTDGKDSDKSEVRKDTVFTITFAAQSADHGVIHVGETELNAETVSSYKKEIQGNTKYTFRVTAADGYTVERVKAGDQEIARAADQADVYEIGAVTGDTVIAVTYQKQSKQDKAAAEAAPEFQRAALTVGQQSYIMGQDGTDHTWDILDESVVSVLSTDGAIAELKANAEGTVYIAHSYFADGESDMRMETFEVTVAAGAQAATEVPESESNGESKSEVSEETEALKTEDSEQADISESGDGEETEALNTETDEETEASVEEKISAETDVLKEEETEAETEVSMEEKVDPETEALAENETGVGISEQEVLAEEEVPEQVRIAAAKAVPMALDNGVALAAEKLYEVAVGETKRFEETRASENETRDHEWVSSDKKIATVEKRNEIAIVTGVKKGEVTITHTYEYKNWKGKWIEKEVTYKVIVTDGMMTLTFHANGGTNAPAAITVALDAENKEIILPGQGSMSRSGYTFMGWGETANSGMADQSNGGDVTIYPAGYAWLIEESKTLYAVWAQSDEAYYFVRLDGSIPTEPGSYSASAYTDQTANMKGTVRYNTFYANTVDGVDDHLGTIPSTSAIRNACNSKAGSIRFGDGSGYTQCRTDQEFEEKYYVLWYVIKQKNPIHVDGVLLKKNLYNVSYNPNALDGQYTGCTGKKGYCFRSRFEKRRLYIFRLVKESVCIRA